MRIRPLPILLASCVVLATATTAFARQHVDFLGSGPAGSDRPAPALAGVTFIPEELPERAPLRLDFDQTQTPPTTPRPKAFVYSDAYRTRAKIHRYASFATLPLFVAEGFLGQSLYSNPTESKKSAHLAVATGIGALFGINGVTGVWNMIEARKDPNGHTKRTIHGILMLAASGGFFITAATGPHDEFGGDGGFRDGTGDGGGSSGSKSLHRGIAFTSIGLATASYLIMLIGR
jgi:hypothetical protein